MVPGGCLCGKIKYELNDGDYTAGLCHCSICRINTGSAFSTNLFVPVSSFHLLSAPETVSRFEIDGTRTGSGFPSVMCFCSSCGTTLWAEPQNPEYAGMEIIKAGTVADRAWLEKQALKVELFKEDGLAWVGDLVGKEKA